MTQVERSRVTPPLPVGPSGPNGSRARAVGRGSLANLVGTAVMALTLFGMTVVVTRGLDRDQAGLFFSSTAVFLLATSLGQLGSNTGLVYFVSRSRSLKRGHQIDHYVSTAHRAVLTAAVATALVLLLVAGPLSRVIAPGGDAEQAATYLRVFALFIPFAGYENVTLAATRGLGNMRTTVVVEQMGRSVLQAVLVALSVWLLHGAGLGWAWAVGYVPAALLTGRAWRRLARDIPRPSQSDLDAGSTRMQRRQSAAGWRREFWRFSAPRAVASVGQQAVQRLDIILIGAISGPAAAAVYTASTRFLVAGQMANRAISTAVQPRLSESLARGDLETAKYLYRVSTGWLTLLTWPVFLSLIVYGERLMAVFGRGYDAGSVVLDILSVSMLWGMACGMVDMVLNMAGRTAWNLVNVGVAFGLNIGLDLWLIPQHSYVGAAIGWAVAIVASNSLALSQIALSMKLHPFGRESLLSLGLPVLCYLLLPLGARPLVGSGSLGVAVGLVGSTVLYAGLLFWARHRLELLALVSPGRSRRRTAVGETPSR